MIANLCLAESIQLPGTKRVEVDWEGKGDEEAAERNHHGDVVAMLVGEETGQRWEEGAAADGSDNPGRTPLRMSTQTTDGKGEDGREDARLKEQYQREHSDTCFTLGPNSCPNEDHDHGHEKHEHKPGLDEHKQACCGKPTDREERLANGVAIRSIGCADMGAFLTVFDELRGDGDLGTNVTELRSNPKEEFVLLAERDFSGVARQVRALFGLQGHVRVCDFGDRREEEDDSKKEHEGCDADVRPLNLGEVVAGGVLEEHAGSQKGRHDGAHSLEGLREFETEFRESGRSAGGNEWVGGCLEG